ncbi:MAG: septum formation protein Maf [Bacteroidales bacterium]|nr:septum formation protein Maf [Bacteroidales bacterium]
MLQTKFLNQKIILASQSPRRQSLLKELLIDFEVRVKDNLEEIYPLELKNIEIAPYLSELKFNAFVSELVENEFLITSDTTVCIENDVLNKPLDRADAIEILKRLSGKKHTVVTGVTIGNNKNRTTFSSFTDVYFRELFIDEICFYIDNYKPFDKAGAYGIQEWIGYVAIERIDGSFYNVMGLPVQKLHEELLKFEL